jgi:xanthine dehydrogenase small subunit
MMDATLVSGNHAASSRWLKHGNTLPVLGARLNYEARHCEEHSDEAIQTDKHHTFLDCFATLAMTDTQAKDAMQQAYSAALSVA